MEYKVGRELEVILELINECIGFWYEENDKENSKEAMRKTLREVQARLRELLGE